MKKLALILALCGQMAWAGAPIGTGPSGSDTSWIPNNECPSQTSKVLSNVCTSCFFPIRVGIQIGGGGSGKIPSDKYSSPVCACPKATYPFIKIGTTGGVWSPEGILEVTPREYCSSTLGGTKVGSDLTNRGVGHWGDQLTYNNVHYIPFPMGQISNLIMGSDSPCGQSGGGWGSVGLWSEIDPTWNDPKLAALKSPDGLPPGGDAPSSMATLVQGCAADYATMQANSNYFGSRWCSGAYGQTYPLTGYAVQSGNPAAISALQSTRLLDEMYRTGMQKKTWGSYQQVCFGKGGNQTAIPKNGHRMQQVAPQGEKRNHRIGDMWNAGDIGGIVKELWNAIPVSVQGHEINNNNYIHVDWKYKECCIGT